MSENNKGASRQDVFDYSLKTFGTSPEYPWRSLPLYAVLRRSDNKKWYALIMNISRNKLGLSGKGVIDILDIKCSISTREFLLNTQKGVLPAYHLNRQNWITVILDGSVDKKLLYGLIAESYELAETHHKTIKI